MIECVRTCIAESGNSPWMAALLVLAALLPTIVTGLTKYPQAAGVLSAVSAFLDRLSVVTHKDAPGSLKLPVKRSANPNGNAPE